MSKRGPIVLVSGGAGYIGSHTVRELGRRGFQPVVLDDLSEGHRVAVKDVPLDGSGDLSKTPLSHVNQFLSYARLWARERAASVGPLHESPSAERLIVSRVASGPSASVFASQTACVAS